jgi:hypothetical protein
LAGIDWLQRAGYADDVLGHPFVEPDPSRLLVDEALVELNFGGSDLKSNGTLEMEALDITHMTHESLEPASPPKLVEHMSLQASDKQLLEELKEVCLDACASLLAFLAVC